MGLAGPERLEEIRNPYCSRIITQLNLVEGKQVEPVGPAKELQAVPATVAEAT